MLSLWVKLVYWQPKVVYNELHPYTSWIPITAFIVLRNLTPGMQLSALPLYSWLGKVGADQYCILVAVVDPQLLAVQCSMGQWPSA